MYTDNSSHYPDTRHEIGYLCRRTAPNTTAVTYQTLRLQPAGAGPLFPQIYLAEEEFTRVPDQNTMVEYIYLVSGADHRVRVMRGPTVATLAQRG